MTNKRHYITGVTPAGLAKYAFISKPETWQGSEVGYSVQIKMSEEDSRKFMEHLLDELEKAKETFDLKPGKRWSKEPSLSMRMDADENILFKFKAKTSVTTRGGDVIKRTIPVVDAKGHPMHIKSLGDGSIIKVAYSAAPYWMSNNQNGMSLYLRAIQVLKYVPYGGNSAESFGFSTDEDGYDVTEDVADEDIVIDDSAEF